MKRPSISVAVVLAVSIGIAASPAWAAKKRKKKPATTTTAPTTEPTTAPAASAVGSPAYRATIEGRTAKIVAALNLNDPAKQAKVHDILFAHYLAMNDWQAANQPDGEALRDVVKDPQKKTSLATLHDQFNQDLASQLTAQQVEAVKDQLTVNKVRVTYDAYLQIVPNITDAEKARMLELLKQAREEAIDGRNMEEKSAIFKVYKGKINLFLSADGHNVSQAYKDWGQSQKAKAGATTKPSATQLE